MSEHNPIRFSDKLTDSIAKLYKLGGLGLVFIFIAIVSMGLAFYFDESHLSSWAFGLGGILLIVSFALFTVVQVKGLMPAKKGIKINKETIDEVQDLSLSLVKLTANTQSYCFKHLDKIKATIDLVLPKITPFMGERGTNIQAQVDDVSLNIVTFSMAIEKTITDIQQALEQGDFETVASYTSKVKALNEQLQEALSNDN